MIEVKHLEKYYGSDGTVTKALDDISFISYDGEFLCIMGASGSGKSTLLNCLSTIDCASAGDILFNGVSFDSLKKSELAAFRRHNLGFIFQNYNLLDTLTLGENISLSLLINGAAQGTIQKRIHDIANQVGIGHLLDKLPSQVSGGERQRCAFARAVVNSPKLIFADEPTGALDSASAIHDFRFLGDHSIIPHQAKKPSPKLKMIQLYSVGKIQYCYRSKIAVEINYSRVGFS